MTFSFPKIISDFCLIDVSMSGRTTIHKHDDDPSPRHRNKFYQKNTDNQFIRYQT